MSKIIDCLEAKESLLAGKGASDEAIAQAEKALGLTFTDEYRDYLRRYAIAAYDGHELTGLSKTPRLHVVDVTREEKARNHSIPDDFYVIECVNVEGIVMWQASDGRIYYSAPQVKYKEYCASLYDYIVKY